MSPMRHLPWLTLAFLGCSPVQPQLKDEFHHDFRGGKMPPLIVQMVGANASRYIRPSSEGLRISLAAEKTPLPQMGISPKFPVAGDFEITVQYQIVKLERPDAGYGSGVSMFIQTQSAEYQAATVGVLLERSNRLHLAANRHSGPKEKRQHLIKVVPADDGARTGSLRLTRSGSLLTYWVAPAKQDFIQLREVDIGPEPLARLRIVADPGGGKGALEVVLSDLKIRAESLTTESEKLERPSAAGNKWLLGGALGTVAIAGGIFLWHRHSRGKTSNNQTGKEHPPTAARRPKAQPQDVKPDQGRG